MTNCVVKGCINQSSKNKKKHGITFHTFPVRHQHMKEKWIAAIRDSRNEPLWKPTSHSVVCSSHFKSSDFYFTKKGLRRVLRTGYPKILPGKSKRSNNLDLSPPIKVEQPDVPEPSFSDVTQPPISYVIIKIKPERLDNDDLSRSIKVEQLEIPDQSPSDVSQPSTLCDIQPSETECLDNFNLSGNIKVEQLEVTLSPSDLIQPSSPCTNVNDQSEVTDQSLSDATSCAEQSEESDLSLSDESQHSTSSIDEHEVPDLTLSDFSRPSSPCEQTDVPDLTVSGVTQPSTSYAVHPVKLFKDPSLSVKQVVSDVYKSLLGFSSDKEIKERIKFLERNVMNSRRKIKTLNQKIRRLRKRNNTLKRKVRDTVKERNLPRTESVKLTPNK